MFCHPGLDPGSSVGMTGYREIIGSSPIMTQSAPTEFSTHCYCRPKFRRFSHNLFNSEFLRFFAIAKNASFREQVKTLRASASLRHELRITNYELRITNYELRITNYELRITNYKLTSPRLTISISNIKITFSVSVYDYRSGY